MIAISFTYSRCFIHLFNENHHVLLLFAIHLHRSPKKRNFQKKKKKKSFVSASSLSRGIFCFFFLSLYRHYDIYIRTFTCPYTQARGENNAWKLLLVCRINQPQCVEMARFIIYSYRGK